MEQEKAQQEAEIAASERKCGRATPTQPADLLTYSSVSLFAKASSKHQEAFLLTTFFPLFLDRESNQWLNHLHNLEITVGLVEYEYFLVNKWLANIIMIRNK